jgi:pimeloyl-ACP methyl ester carboxylesterase
VSVRHLDHLLALGYVFIAIGAGELNPLAISPTARTIACRAMGRMRIVYDVTGLPVNRADKQATAQGLARYWSTEYDWRKGEAKLNALPQFTTEVDGLSIHFIHVRSPHENALPLIMTHGWPGSVVELLETVGPLTDPTAHGGDAEDAFHLVLPSVPGYCFSAEPTELGWWAGRVAQAWPELLRRLGYTRYVARAATSAPPSPTRWAALRPRGSSASIRTCSSRHSAA